MRPDQIFGAVDDPGWDEVPVDDVHWAISDWHPVHDSDLYPAPGGASPTGRTSFICTFPGGAPGSFHRMAWTPLAVPSCSLL